MDLISELPDPILQHILSFLPIKQIIQTTLLSKRYTHLWFTFPSFEFDSKFFHFEFKQSPDHQNNTFHHLINFVEQTLKHLKSLTKFKLHTDFPGPSVVIDQWIDYVLESGVQELEIIVTVENGNRYILPQRVFTNQSLTVLTVGDCKLLCPPLDGFKLLRMKKVNRLGVFADDEIVKRLVSNCPLIEDIKLNSCLGLRSLWLCETNELKTMEVQNNSGLFELGIKAMNLQAFEFRGQFQPCCINISSCKNLKTLKLSMVAITDDWLHHCISELPLLQTLALSHCHMLESLRISSPHLKKFILCGCESVTNAGISLNAPALLQADVELSPRIFDNSWLVKQIKFLAHFNHLKSVVVPQELRETFGSPLYGVKHMKLKIIKPLFSPSLQELVKALLWIAPKPHTITIESGFGKKIFKFVYEKARDGSDHHCSCDSLPITCWKHSLKELKFENIRDHEEINNLNNFFHENAEMLHYLNINVVDIS